MEKKIGNVKESAAILSSFNFKDTVYCHVIVYFKIYNGYLGVGKLCDAALPKEIGYLPPDDSFKTWDEKEWEAFILEGAGHISSQSPTHVASIWICFDNEASDDFSEKLFAPIYTIETTDTTSGRFDRVATERLGGIYGAMLTESESTCINGAADVMRLSGEIPATRWKKAPNEYAKIINDHIVDIDKAYMCHRDI